MSTVELGYLSAEVNTLHEEAKATETHATSRSLSLQMNKNHQETPHTHPKTGRYDAILRTEEQIPAHGD